MDEPALKAKTPEGHAIAAARVSALGGTELRLDAPGGGSAQVLDGIQIRTKLKLNSAPETTLAKSSKISQFFLQFVAKSSVFRKKMWFLEQCKGVHFIDFGESFQTHIYLQNFVSIQPRTSPPKCLLNFKFTTSR